MTLKYLHIINENGILDCTGIAEMNNFNSFYSDGKSLHTEGMEARVNMSKLGQVYQITFLDVPSASYPGSSSLLVDICSNSKYPH